MTQTPQSRIQEARKQIRIAIEQSGPEEREALINEVADALTGVVGSQVKETSLQSQGRAYFGHHLEGREGVAAFLPYAITVPSVDPHGGEDGESDPEDA